jgi:hypothetical protein
MKYTIEVGSGAMIYIPGSTKIGSGIQEDMQRHRQQDYLISLLLFF